MSKLTNNTRLMLGSIIVALALLIGGYWSTISRHQTPQVKVTSSTKPQSHARQPSIKSQKTVQSTPIDWRAPSENKPYPNLAEQADLWIDVSIARQRVYLKNGNDLLYTMYASTGSPKSPTPTGTFYIEAEHGDSFFNTNSEEGAKYWRSFLDHGIYLFHSVPTDKAGHFIPEEAEQLGQKANSHGCIRLSVADAQWFYTAIPYNTKVVIH